MNLRKLGTGHWDRKLIERMLENSFADNIDEALKEWMATGNCWWPSLASKTPEWVYFVVTLLNSSSTIFSAF